MRIIFKKTGMIRFTSHLDTMRMFSRAFYRSGLDVWFTEGFNPHPYIVLPLPLSLGFETQCDMCDFRLTKPAETSEIINKLQKALPSGIEIINAYSGGNACGDIGYVAYKTIIEDSITFEESVISKVKKLFEKPSIIMEKRTKKGIADINIKDYIINLDLSLSETGELQVDSLLKAGEMTLNPDFLVAAIKQEIEGDIYAKHLRLAVFDKQMNLFR